MSRVLAFDRVNLRVQAALAAFPECLHWEVLRASNEKRPINREAVAEDAFLAADAFVKEAQGGPRLYGEDELVRAIDPPAGATDALLKMPACAEGRLRHRSGPDGFCLGCGIQVEAVREVVKRNLTRQRERERKRTIEAAFKRITEAG